MSAWLLAAALAGAAHCPVPDGPVRASATLPGGRTVVARDGALVLDGRPLTVCDGLPGAFPTALAAAPDGQAVYVGFRREGVWRLDERGLTELSGFPPAALQGGVRALAADGTGLWVGTGTAGLFHVSLDGTALAVTHKVLGTHPVFALRAESAGGVSAAMGPYGTWAVTAPDTHGATRVTRRAGGFAGCFDASGRPQVFCEPGEPGRASGLPAAHLTALQVHRGRMYVGSFDAGLVRSADGLHFEAVPGLPPFVNALASDGETLYVGTSRGLFALSGETGPARAIPGFGGHVNGLATGPDATLAVATSQGVQVLARGAVRRLTESDGLPSRLVYAVAFDAAGTLWAGTADGLVRFGPEGPPERFSQATGHLTHDWVTALLPDGDGLFVGTYDAGVVRLAPDAVSVSGWQATARARAAWVNPNGLVRLGAETWVLTLGGGAGPIAGDGWRAVLPAALDDVTAAAAFRDEIWVATRGGLVRAPASWYGAAHDTAQVRDDFPGFFGHRDLVGLRDGR